MKDVACRSSPGHRRSRTRSAPAGSRCRTWANFVFIAAPTGHPPDRVEAEPTAAQGAHNEPAALVGRIRLVTAPPAERHEPVQIEVRAALRALHHVVDVVARELDALTM